MTNRTRRKLQTLTAAAVAITAIILLTGCAGETAGPATRAECADADGYGPRECTITLEDTRRVNCIEDAGSHGIGLSCDWDHADGGDDL
ncbi:hypothetical protein [Bifidobacterium catulorum]|uniref:Uncharacterized protein n=1 Tax=Bifidobacterium catulorum TaxID=1630173 RepID=A0A2U2MUF1_9BIFI|nr:hypothetical protein [Bifidobacterium catulorum]PWG60490.1 hypothetical protein DF200_02520 [Bifidobacterium catulorum]